MITSDSSGSSRIYYDIAGRFVTVPDTCEGCGQCCKNFATLVNTQDAEFFNATSPETAQVIVTPVEISSKLSTNEKRSRTAAVLSANLGVLEDSFVLHAVASGDGLVKIVGNCGNLDKDNCCTTYANRPKRPCREITLGSQSCLHALDIAQNPHLHVT